jgi:hypothetical protein
MRNLHEWNLSYAEARRVQGELAGRVEFVPLETEPQIIAGLDLCPEVPHSRAHAFGPSGGQ